jgi:pyruvate dehydrogenase E1 component beta subunit
MRFLTYCDAIKEAQWQEMERDSDIFMYGIGVPDHKAIFGSVAGIYDKFGEQRCFDTPLSEDTMMGFGLGAALNGLRPINIHIRVDFLLLAMNQLANMVSTYQYMSGSTLKVPLVIRAVIGRGWGQGAQHSKSMQSVFTHIPGLKVIMPTTPRDAKGMLISAIRDSNPVIMIEHRWLYWQEDEVPEEPYTVPLEGAAVLKEGSDITIVATSWMNVEALRASEILEKIGVSVEIIDVRTLSPLNPEVMIKSVNKTGYCIIADNDWTFCGYSAELATVIGQKCFGKLKKPIERIGFAFTPCPTVRSLENEFYPNAVNIIRSVEKLLGLSQTDLTGEEFYSHEKRFKGPF